MPDETRRRTVVPSRALHQGDRRAFGMFRCVEFLNRIPQVLRRFSKGVPEKRDLSLNSEKGVAAEQKKNPAGKRSSGGMEGGSGVRVLLLFRLDLNGEFPLGAFAEGGFEGAFQNTFLLQMDVAGHIAGASADAAQIGVLDRRIEEGFVDDLPGALRRELRLAGDDRETVRFMQIGVRRHEGILRHVGTHVVGGALPVVDFPA